MTWYPISHTAVQYVDANGTPYSGAVLKAYAAGTSTTINMATDYTGGTTATSFALDASGYPITSGNAQIIPHIDQSYKLAIYPDQASADANSGAIWGPTDNMRFSTAAAAPWAVAGGTADAITASYDPANTTLTDGLFLTFRASAANATTTPTFSPDSPTAHTITLMGGTALKAGDIPGALAECEVRYNLANTRWELLNPAASVLDGAITEAKITLADVTTLDVSTVAHGFVPKATGSTTTFLNANGAYATPTQVMTPLAVGSIIWATATTTKSAGATIAASALTAKGLDIIGGSSGTISTGDSLSGTYQAIQSYNASTMNIGPWQRTV